MALTPKESIKIILSEFPDFSNQWIAYVKDWNLEIDRPFGLDIAEFSEFASNIIKFGSDINLEKIVELTEQLITSGNEEVKQNIKFRFLENITNKMEEIPIQRFTKLLKANTKEACIEIDRLWGTRTPGLY